MEVRLKSISIISIFFLSTLALTKFTFANENSQKQSQGLLKKILKSSHQDGSSLKKLPQNFGGQAPKLNIDKSQEISKVALSLALLDEQVFQEVMADVFNPLQAMIDKKQVALGKLSMPDIQIDLAEQKWKSMLEGVTEVAFFEIAPYSQSTSISEREPKTSKPTAFLVKARYDLRGFKKELRIHNRGEIEVQVTKLPTQWKIQSLKIQPIETLSSAHPTFTEINAFADSKPTEYLRKEAIRRGGYALSVGDLNGDKIADLLIGNLGYMEVFLGSSEGSYKKVTPQSMGLKEETLVKSAVIADFNNDGKNDLLLVRFAPSEQKGNDIVFYKNVGGKFEKNTTIKNRYPAYYAMPSAIADYNQDGLLDFYIGFPGAKDFTVLNKTNHGFKGLKELHPQGLFYNQQNFVFTEVTKEKLPYTQKTNAYTNGYPETASIFPHSSMGIDYDLDGDMDIVVIDDKANLSPLYKNTGDGQFEQVAEKIGLTNYDFGMGFTAADFDNDGTLEFVYSNVNFLPAERLHNGLQLNFSEYSKLPGTYGLRIFKSKDGKNYSDVTAISGIKGCGAGIGGVEAIDYNNDGYMDLYVTNGLWSGNSREQDLSSLFVRANSISNYDYQETMGDAHGVEEANTSFMKILKDYQGNIEPMVSKKGTHPSMAGFQRNCLFKNNQDGTFLEVGFLEGVDSIADGYIVATSDINNDGKMDLILRNGDAGVAANRYPAVQVFVNQSKDAQKSVILSFEGKKSNYNGMGVTVHAKIGAKKFIRHLVANNGASQSEAIVHFGLGSEKRINQLEIVWPSGIKQILQNVNPGRHHIVEESTTQHQTAQR